MYKLKYGFPYVPKLEGSFTPKELYSYLVNEEYDCNRLAFTIRSYLVQLSLIITIQADIGLCDRELYQFALDVISRFIDVSIKQKDINVILLKKTKEAFTRIFEIETTRTLAENEKAKNERRLYSSLRKKGLPCKKFSLFKVNTRAIKKEIGSITKKYNTYITSLIELKKTTYCKPLFIKNSFMKNDLNLEYVSKYHFPLLIKSELLETLQDLSFIHESIKKDTIKKIPSNSHLLKYNIDEIYRFNESLRIVENELYAENVDNKNKDTNDKKSGRIKNGNFNSISKEMNDSAIKNIQSTSSNSDKVARKKRNFQTERQSYINSVEKHFFKILEELKFGSVIDSKFVIPRRGSEVNEEIYRRLALPVFIIRDYQERIKQKVTYSDLVGNIIILLEKDYQDIQENRVKGLSNISLHSSTQIEKTFTSNVTNKIIGKKFMEEENKERIKICLWFKNNYPNYLSHYSDKTLEKSNVYEIINNLIAKNINA